MISRHSCHRFHILFARAVGDRVGQFIKQDMRFAVQHFVALLDGALADGLRQVTFACSAGTEKQRVFALVLMNAAVARSNTRLRFIFGLKVKSKLSRVRSVIAKGGLFTAALE